MAIYVAKRTNMKVFQREGVKLIDVDGEGVWNFPPNHFIYYIIGCQGMECGVWTLDQSWVSVVCIKGLLLHEADIHKAGQKVPHSTPNYVEIKCIKIYWRLNVDMHKAQKLNIFPCKYICILQNSRSEVSIRLSTAF